MDRLLGYAKKDKVRDSGAADLHGGESSDDQDTETTSTSSSETSQEVVSQVATTPPAVLTATQRTNRMGGTTLTLPEYSGFPKFTQYKGRKGIEREMLDALEFIEQVEIRGTGAGYKADELPGQACLALIQGTPAYNWWRNQHQKGTIKTWAEFKKSLLRHFLPPLDPTQRANNMKDMRQGKDESIINYYNRTEMSWDDNLKGTTNMWSRAPFNTAKPEELEWAKRGGDAMQKWIWQGLWLGGLQREYVDEITTSGVETMDEMVTVAERKERTKRKGGVAGEVNSVQTGGGGADPFTCQPIAETPATPSTSDPEWMRKAITDLTQVVAAIRKGGAGKGGGNGKGKEGERKPTICYYCQKKGHYSSICNTRKADREAGNWRPTSGCPKMTKDEYDRLSPEEKNKGRDLVMNKGNTSKAPASTVNVRQQQEAQVVEDIREVDYQGYYEPKN